MNREHRLEPTPLETSKRWMRYPYEGPEYVILSSVATQSLWCRIIGGKVTSATNDQALPKTKTNTYGYCYEVQRQTEGLKKTESPAGIVVVRPLALIKSNHPDSGRGKKLPNWPHPARWGISSRRSAKPQYSKIECVSLSAPTTTSAGVVLLYMTLQPLPPVQYLVRNLLRKAKHSNRTSDTKSLDRSLLASLK